MKSVISIFILFLFITKLNAQFSENNAIYFTGNVYGGNYYGANMSLNYVIYEKYSFQLGISGLLRQSKSEPEDYTSGATALFTLGLSELHFDYFDSYEFLVGRIFKTNKSSNTRWNISGGLGYTQITEPTNWTPVSTFTIGSNYTYDVVKKGTVSLIFNPKVEFPFSQIFGLTLSLNLQVNKERTYFGVGFGVMMGLLRKKNPQVSPVY